MASVGGGASRTPSGGWLQDVVRFPSRQFDLDTELTQAESVERLRAIAEPGSVFLASFRRTNKLFAGEVWPDGFKVMRLIYYGNSGLPVVEGRLQPGPIGTRVQVTMRLMQSARIFSMLWFGFLAFLVGSMVGVAVPHLMIRSTPYRIAESFIRSNPVIEDELGPVRGVNLELTGNSVGYAGPESSARFAFDVQGTHGNGIVLVALRKHLGAWHIGTADLRETDGRMIPLQAGAAAETTEPGR
jgi:hypothetical protein